MRARLVPFTVLAVLAGALLRAAPAAAIPVFARVYDKPCATCHTLFPQLNPEGEDFRARGFHGLPPAVAPMRVGPYVSLPRTLPLALYLASGEDVGKTTGAGASTPTHTHFDLQFLSLLAGGELGPHLAFLIDYEVLETEPETGATTVNTLPEQAYLQAHADALGWLGNVRLGWFELPLGISPRVHRLSAAPYLTYGLSGCGVLGHAPSGVACGDVAVPGEPQIGAELSALRPSTGLGWAVGATNGSNSRMDDRASPEVYLRVSQAIGLHKAGLFLLYSPDALGAGAKDRTLRVGPDFTWYTRRFRALAQLLASFESSPTGRARDLWYYAGFLESEYRMTPTVLALARAEYAWSSRFDDTAAGGVTRARRRLWAATAGAQWALLQNFKLVAEATYGEDREAVSNATARTWSVTVRAVTAFWALDPVDDFVRWPPRLPTS